MTDSETQAKIQKWYDDHCYAPNDCVVPSDNGDISVDLTDLFNILGITTTDTHD